MNNCCGITIAEGPVHYCSTNSLRLGVRDNLCEK